VHISELEESVHDAQRVVTAQLQQGRGLSLLSLTSVSPERNEQSIANNFQSRSFAPDLFKT